MFDFYTPIKIANAPLNNSVFDFEHKLRLSPLLNFQLAGALDNALYVSNIMSCEYNTAVLRLCGPNIDLGQKRFITIVYTFYYRLKSLHIIMHTHNMYILRVMYDV